jgi:DNA-binding response OmpR family regulator
MASLCPNPLPAQRSPRSAIVLFVEDEILIRAAVSEYLRKLGYVVVEAADATEAMAVFSCGEPIDVVLCDVDLPGTMDGLSLACWISRRRAAPPVLLTSGRRISLSASKIPASSFIPKPYHLRALAKRLESMLGSGNSPAGDTGTP